MEKQEHEQGKTFTIFECSVPHTSSYIPDDMKEKLASPGNADYIPETMPNIREIYVEAEKTDNLQTSGMEVKTLSEADTVTLEQRIKQMPHNKAQSTILMLAGCAIEQRKNAFEVIESQLDNLRDQAYSMLKNADKVQEQLDFVKKLAVIE
ncbi:MAG: hypothetical protein ACW99G_00520 [Candidatus Thorarchaeota archaeon]|jgi:hypothetical protein